MSKDMLTSRARFTSPWIYLAAATLLASLALTVRPAAWQGGVVTHTMLELAATLLAFVVGVVAMIRYFARRETLHLFVGIGFLGAALFDGQHLLLTSPWWLGSVPPADRWNWNPSRIFLALELAFGWWACRRELHSGRAPEYSVYVRLAVLTLLSFAVAVFAAISRRYAIEGLLGRPDELLAGALFLIALLGFVRLNEQSPSVVLRWLTLALVFSFVGQVFVMSRSHALFDALFMAGHWTKIACYLCVLMGLLIDFYRLSTEAQRGQESLAKAVNSLQQEMAERERAQRETLLAHDALKSRAAELEGSHAAALNILQDMEISRQQAVRAEQATGDQAARTQAILDGATDAIITISATGVIESFNAAAERMFGYSARDAIGENVKMLMPPPYHDEHDQYLCNYLETGISKIIGIGREVVGLSSDGRTFPIDLTVSVVQLGDRRMFTGIVRDITERKRAEEALLRNEARKSAVLETALDAIVTMDHEGKIVEFNPAAEQIFGYRRDEALGQEMAELIIPPHQRENHRRGLARYLATREATVLNRRIELTAMRSDGTEFPVEVAITPIERDGPPMFTGFLRDITAPKLAELQLREAHDALKLRAEELEAARRCSLRAEQDAREHAARTQAILDGATDAIITINADGAVESFNVAAEKIFGYAAHEVIGKNVNVLMPSPYHEEHDQYLDNYLQSGISKIIGIGREVLGLRADGTTFPMHLAISEVKLGDRRMFTGIVRDISTLKRTMFQLSEANDELARRSRQIERFNNDLSRSNEDLKQFAYVASHDLQEPLRKVTAFCQMLRDDYGDRLDENARTYIQYAVDGAQRMKTLVQDLLTYSRVETQGKPFEPVDADDACAEAIENLTIAIDEAAAEITRDQLPTVNADRAQLVRLFQNLIGNAIKYRGAEPPRIHVSAVESGGEWVFRICDNGIGIDPQYHERIFVIFQRLHGREEYSGTGIGLAVCKRIVERAGGRIWVESQVGAGSEFCFAVPIPLCQSHTSQEGVPNNDRKSLQAAGAAHRHPVGRR